MFDDLVSQMQRVRKIVKLEQVGIEAKNRKGPNVPVKPFQKLNEVYVIPRNLSKAYPTARKNKMKDLTYIWPKAKLLISV